MSSPTIKIHETELERWRDLLADALRPKVEFNERDVNAMKDEAYSLRGRAIEEVLNELRQHVIPF